MIPAHSKRINPFGSLSSLIVVRPPFNLLAIPMSTHPPSPPANDLHDESHQLASPPSTIHTPPIGVQPEEGGILCHSTHYHELSPLQIDRSPATDLGTLVDLAGRLQPFLPSGYRWLGRDDLKVVGIRPFDAGGFADVWVGEVGNRTVALKSYRCFTSADYLPTYNVSYP